MLITRAGDDVSLFSTTRAHKMRRDLKEYPMKFKFLEATFAGMVLTVCGMASAGLITYNVTGGQVPTNSLNISGLFTSTIDYAGTYAFTDKLTNRSRQLMPQGNQQ
jgi:hypothetical protein